MLGGLIESYASSDSDNDTKPESHGLLRSKADFPKQNFVPSTEVSKTSEGVEKSKDEVDVKVESFLAVSSNFHRKYTRAIFDIIKI